jgi:probable HAF family extracellular repeat protein
MGTNNKGAIVGNGYPAFLYSEGTYTELLPPGWAESYVFGVNDKGAVVGYGWGADGAIIKGFLYSKGAYTELLPPGWAWAAAMGINEKGVVVGWGYDGTIYKGFIATPKK